MVLLKKELFELANQPLITQTAKQPLTSPNPSTTQVMRTTQTTNQPSSLVTQIEETSVPLTEINEDKGLSRIQDSQPSTSPIQVRVDPKVKCCTIM